MDPKTKIIRMLKYLRGLFLAVTVFLIPLPILATLPELLRERISLINILRNMLPGLLAAGTAFFLASRFVEALYDLSDWRVGAKHIWRSIFGQPSFRPFVMVAEGKISEAASDSTLMRIGGRGAILTYNDSATVLEQGGRLTRVIGPGQMDLLELFERVRDVIDLRPMRWEYAVDALSKEGIPVTVSVDVTFQVDTGGREPTDKTPFPALNEAVFKASTCRWMRHPGGSDDDQYFDWARRVIISETEGDLRGIIARYRLDALVGLEDRPEPGADLPREAIQKELTGTLRKSCASLGAQINDVQIGTIKVKDEVARQWIESWQNEWQNWAMVQEKTGEAKREQLRESARAQAQVDMITAVARAFQQSISRDARIPSQLLIMRLIEVFDRFALDRNTIIYLPEKTIGTLKRLRELVMEEPRGGGQ